MEFFAEAQDLVTRVHEDTSLTDSEVFRFVHTLKGNCGIYGIYSVAAVCHQLETVMQETEARLTTDDSKELVAKWSEIAGTIGKLVGDDGGKRIEINDGEYSAILKAIGRGAPRAEIMQKIAEWKLEPTEQRLQRVAEQARNLAVRLGKGQIGVRIEPNGLRIYPSNWADFWGAFAHVLRNAVDHGIEPQQEREKANKSPFGNLTLRTVKIGHEFVIEIADDGRGIDWERVAIKARIAGLPADTHEDLMAALFHDGISTKDTVTDTSGRGVGMAAIRDATELLNGRIMVTSTRGHGTTVQFAFPVAAMIGRAMESTAAMPIVNTVPPGPRASMRPQL